MTTPLPPLPDRDLLADLCREAAERERLQPQVVEKDFHLTRLLWALGQTLGDQVLLKGGTLLSKVDLGFTFGRIMTSTRTMLRDAFRPAPVVAADADEYDPLAPGMARDHD